MVKKRNQTPVDRPTMKEYVVDNAYIVKKFVRELWRYNAATALKITQPTLANIKFGKTPFEYDWDALVILDTCRPDALQEYTTMFEWLPSTIPRVRSPASWSKSFLRLSFNPDEYGDEMSESVHVTWNPFSDTELNASDWLVLDEVWRCNWDDDLGMLPPEVVTNHAIHHHRNHPDKKLIVHYQQPHQPYRTVETETLTSDMVGNPDTERRVVWDRLADPDDPLTKQDAWDGMMDNLQWVLREGVEPLLNNITADRVLLTADHGEMFGFLGVHGHGPGMPFPWLINVPHVYLSATDTHSLCPDASAMDFGGVGGVGDGSGSSGSVDDHLVALGYK